MHHQPRLQATSDADHLHKVKTEEIIMSAPSSVPGCDRRSEEPLAGHREPRTYVTVISVPYFGDGGVQRLHGRMKDPGSEPETDLSDAGIEAG
jgi:hypothetical protein